MKPARYSKGNPTPRVRREKGDVLIEALIGTLLTAIVFVGVNSSLSRTLHSQRYSNAQHLALLQMREEVQNGGITDICSGSLGNTVVAGKTVSKTAACNSAELTVAINSDLSITLAPGVVPATSFSLSTDSGSASQELFGADGVITLSY